MSQFMSFGREEDSAAELVSGKEAPAVRAAGVRGAKHGGGRDDTQESAAAEDKLVVDGQIRWV